MTTIERFIQVGQGYERDEFVADEDELIEYDDHSQDQDEDSFASDEATDSDLDDEESLPNPKQTRSSTCGFYKSFRVGDDDDGDVKEDEDFSDDSSSDSEEPPLFQRMTRARARALKEEKSRPKQVAKNKKRQAEPEEEDSESDQEADIYLSEPESDEDLLASVTFSMDRHRLSFQQLYEFHVQYTLKRILYPRIDAALSNKMSKEYKRAQLLYADRLVTQIDASLNNLAFSQAWRPETLVNVQRMPYMTKKKLKKFKRNQQCDACQRVHTVVSYVLFFWGAKCKEGKLLENAKKQMDKGYQNVLGEEDADDISVIEQRTMFVGNTCAARLKLYHKLYHRDVHMVIDLMDELESIKGDLSSFRTLREGKRVAVEPSPDQLEKQLDQGHVLHVANKFAGLMHRAISKCADFTEGGKHVWSKRKYNPDIRLFKLSEYDSDDSDAPDVYPSSDYAEISDDDDEEEDAYLY